MLIYRILLWYFQLIIQNTSCYFVMIILFFSGFMLLVIQVRFLNFSYTLNLWFNANYVSLLNSSKLMVTLSLKSLKLFFSKVDISYKYPIHTILLIMELWKENIIMYLRLAWQWYLRIIYLYSIGIMLLDPQFISSIDYLQKHFVTKGTFELLFHDVPKYEHFKVFDCLFFSYLDLIIIIN